jgi:hypothetical protein
MGLLPSYGGPPSLSHLRPNLRRLPPPVIPRSCPEPGRGRMARYAEGVPLKKSTW